MVWEPVDINVDKSVLYSIYFHRFKISNVTIVDQKLCFKYFWKGKKPKWDLNS